MTRIIGVIPARFGSTRFEGKPLAPILGKPMLQWVVEGARKSTLLSDLIVATDDNRILRLAQSLGVSAIITESNLPTGSDRVWKAIEFLSCDGVINIQGDEPLVTSKQIDTLALALAEDNGIEMVTLGRPITSMDELNNPNMAKILVNKESRAIYFSRFPVPYSRNKPGKNEYSCLKHIGFYGYTKAFLKKYCDEPPSMIEKGEGLEQLRALWLGAEIKVVLDKTFESWSVDTPEDVIRVEKLLKERDHK